MATKWLQVGAPWSLGKPVYYRTSRDLFCHSGLNCQGSDTPLFLDLADSCRDLREDLEESRISAISMWCGIDLSLGFP